MRYSEKAGYAAIAEVLREPLAEQCGIECIVEGAHELTANKGRSIALPDGFPEYLRLIRSRRI